MTFLCLCFNFSLSLSLFLSSSKNTLSVNLCLSPILTLSLPANAFWLWPWIIFPFLCFLSIHPQLSFSSYLPSLCLRFSSHRPLSSIFNLSLILIFFLFGYFPLSRSTPLFFFYISHGSKVWFKHQKQTKLLVFKVRVNHKQDQMFFSSYPLFSFSHLNVFFMSIIRLVILLWESVLPQMVNHTRTNTTSLFFSGFLRSLSLSLSLLDSLLSLLGVRQTGNPHNVSWAGGEIPSVYWEMRKGSMGVQGDKI